MQKFLLLLVFCFSLMGADDENAKVVYDLTTKEVARFEKNILKGIVMNKGYFESTLRELDVAVVIHGGAYRFFVKDLQKSKFKGDKKLAKVYNELKKRIASLHDTYGVAFLMCGAAMKKNELKSKDVVSFVTIVPNSTIGLIEKQNEGYAYIPVRD